MDLSACGPGQGRVMPLTPPPLAANYTGGYVRQQSAFTGRVSADGSTRHPAQPGRYQLAPSQACPACRGPASPGSHRRGPPALHPPAQRREIDAVSALVFSTVNNGVYKAGLAATQAQYEEAFDALFTTLAAPEERLSRRRFLLGDQ